MGKYTPFQLHVSYKTFVPKIIKIQQRLLELPRKTSGVFFIETQCTVGASANLELVDKLIMIYPYW